MVYQKIQRKEKYVLQNSNTHDTSEGKIFSTLSKQTKITKVFIRLFIY